MNADQHDRRSAAIDKTAKTLREAAAKAGNVVSQEQARARVAGAIHNCEQRRDGKS